MSLSQYQIAFHKEVYALMRDAYEESFTPGSDSVKTPGKPVTMKPDFYRLMADIAVKKLARAGHSVPAGFSVDKEAGAVFAAPGSLVSNPSTPRMFSDMYTKNPFFERFFRGMRKNPGTSPDVDLFQQFKATHQHMSSLYFKRNGVERSKFEFPKGTGDATQLKEVVLNQYRNYVMSLVILSLVQLAYEITPGQIDEILSSMGVKSMEWKKLDAKETRLAFGEAFVGLLKNVFGGQNLGGAIISKIKTGGK